MIESFTNFSIFDTNILNFSFISEDESFQIASQSSKFDLSEEIGCESQVVFTFRRQNNSFTTYY